MPGQPGLAVLTAAPAYARGTCGHGYASTGTDACLPGITTGQPGRGVGRLGLEEDAAERLAAFDVGVGGCGVGEGEGAVDDHA
jgi:hypothetical protein